MLPDALVRLLMVVFLQVVFPVPVKLFQCFDLMDPGLPEKSIDHLMEFFYFPL